MLYEAWPFKKLTITALHNILSFVALSKFSVFAISPEPYSSNKLHKNIFLLL